jgi:hypothetical protein
MASTTRGAKRQLFGNKRGRATPGDADGPSRKTRARAAFAIACVAEAGRPMIAQMAAPVAPEGPEAKKVPTRPSAAVDRKDPSGKADRYKTVSRSALADLLLLRDSPAMPTLLAENTPSVCSTLSALINDNDEDVVPDTPSLSRLLRCAEAMRDASPGDDNVFSSSSDGTDLEDERRSRSNGPRLRSVGSSTDLEDERRSRSSSNAGVVEIKRVDYAQSGVGRSNTMSPVLGKVTADVLRKLPMMFKDDDGRMKLITGGTYGVVEALIVDGTLAVRKTSRQVDYTIELEARTMEILDLETTDFPNFPRIHSTTRVYAPRKECSTRLYARAVPGRQMSAVLSSPDVSGKTKVDLIRQTMAVMEMTHSKLRITHNDLHTGNVLVTPDANDVNVYSFADGTIVEVLTHGYRPVIIDWGFANVTRGAGPIRAACSLTSIGLFPFHFDALRDVMVLMRTAADQMSADSKGYVGRQFNDAATLEYYNTTMAMWKDVYVTPDFSIFYRGTFSCLQDKIYAFLHRRADDDETAQRESVALVGLMLAHVSVPLVKRRVQLTPAEIETCYLKTPVSEFDVAWAVTTTFLRIIKRLRFKAVDVKNAIDSFGWWKNDGATATAASTRLTAQEYEELRDVISRQIDAYTNVLLNYVGEMESAKAKKYGAAANATMLSCLCQLRHDPIEYVEGMRVAFYDCATGKREEVKTLTKLDASLYNNRHM